MNTENDKFHQVSLEMVDKEFQFGELGEIDAHKWTLQSSSYLIDLIWPKIDRPGESVTTS